MKMHDLETADEAQDAWATIRDGLRVIRKHLRPYRRTVRWLIVFSIISAVVNAAVPLATGRFIDALIASDQGLALSILAVWFVLQAVTVFVDGGIDLVRIRLESTVQAAYIHRGFSHLLNLPIGYHKQQKLGELNQRISRAAGALERFVGSDVIVLLPQFLAIAIALVVSFTINPILGALLVFGVLLYLLVLWRVTPQTVSVGKESYDAWRSGFGLAWDIGQNVLEVKQAAAEAFEDRRLHDRFVQQAARIQIKLGRLRQKLLIGQRLLIMLTQFSIFAVAVWLVIGGRLSVGELVMFNAYVAMLYGPFVQLGQRWQSIQEGMIAVLEGEEILEQEPEVYIPPNAVSLSPLHGDVRFEGVSFGYGESQDDVLSDVSFTLRSGQTVALVGRSGVGKTTLVNIVSGYMMPTSGSVFIDGHDLRELDLHVLRRQIAYVPQEPALFNDTILANIAYGTQSSDEEILNAARLAQVDEFVERFPDKYEQLVGWRGIRLSTGQKQRVAIARAILRNPRMLILDEPTSALDAQTEQQLVQESLRTLMAGRTTFVIAHRMSTVRNADLILVLDEGKIAEEGTHSELMRIPEGIYRGFQELQQLPIEELTEKEEEDRKLDE